MAKLPLSILTWNVYLGGDVIRVINAPAVDLPQRSTSLWSMVQHTDFPARARMLAAEIARLRPDVLSLQEVYRWSVRGPVNRSGTQPPQRVVYDFLLLLQRALARAGTPYETAVRSLGVNVVLPTADGGTVQLEDSVALLVRNGSDRERWSWSTPRQGRFSRNLVAKLDGEPFTIRRGWAAVDVHRSGHVVRVIGTHVEAFDAEVQPAQVAELLADPASVTGPAILTGDFNCRPGSNAWKRLREADFADVWETHGSGLGHTSGADEDLRNLTPQFYERIDWILARGALAPQAATLVAATVDSRTGSGLWPSDHAGVFAALELTDSKPVRPVRPTPMPKPVAPLDVVRTLFQHFEKLEVAAILELIDPDAHLHFPGDPAILPWAGDYRGAGMMRFFTACNDTLDYLNYKAHTLHAVGDIVTALSSETCRVKATGRIFTHELAAVIRIRNGRVVEFLEYADTAAMHAAFAPAAKPSKPTKRNRRSRA